MAPGPLPDFPVLCSLKGREMTVGWPEASHGCDLTILPCCWGRRACGLGHESVVGVKLFLLKPQARDGYEGKEQPGGWGLCRSLPKSSGKGWVELSSREILSGKARAVI